MPDNGPLPPSAAVPEQVVMAFPVKVRRHGYGPPFAPALVHVFIQVPPKSPRLDAADVIFFVVKVKSMRGPETPWQAPSISIELTVSVQVSTALWPGGPICIVQEPPRSKGTMPALKVAAVWL